MADSDSPREGSLTQHNLEATVGNEVEAEQALKDLETADLDVEVTVDADEDRRAVLRAEMRDELEASVMGPGPVGPFTKGMTKGILKWVALGAALGSAILFFFGLFMWSSTVGLVATTAIGATAGATLGFVVGGSMGPRKHNEGQPIAETSSVVGIHAASEQEIKEADRLVSGKTVRKDRVDAAGRPATPSTKDTRPVRGETPT